MPGNEDARILDMQFVALKEILRMHVIQVALIMAYYRKSRLGKRLRATGELKYEIVSKLPDQEKHLSRLYGVSGADCIANLRMDRRTFSKLCVILRERGGLADGRFVTVEEQVAMFLSVLAHHKKNRVVRFDFWRSGWTISHYIHIVLGAVIRLHDLFLSKPEAVTADCNDPRWRWFKHMMEFPSQLSNQVPQCSCGEGIMNLKCAGFRSRNPGRFYYKFPTGITHEKGFYWYDEYHLLFYHEVPRTPGSSTTQVGSQSVLSPHVSPDIVKGGEVFGSCMGLGPQCGVFEFVRAALCFTILVLVIGILIGKFM